MRLLLRYWPLPLLVALQLLFWQVPAIDLVFSGWFWNADTGFYLRDLPPVRWSYLLFKYLPYAVVPGLVWLFVASLIWGGRGERALRRRLLFLFLVLAIGPGLLVNEVFKAESGRARPSTVEQFGGDRHFTPAFEPSDQCASNCSFVSGHAGMGFFFLALAWVLKDRRWFYWGALLGAVVGLGRILQGAHFLSDVIFGYPVVFVTALLLARPLLGFWLPPRARQSADLV
ncbi:MAG: phosphatase PAP2 family protein [Gammaproteobacteria bacterium]|nr:MAG: phosphatase PAP2 family protein [Gammaproteobacteria bacterium]